MNTCEMEGTYLEAETSVIYTSWRAHRSISFQSNFLNSDALKFQQEFVLPRLWTLKPGRKRDIPSHTKCLVQTLGSSDQRLSKA